MSDSAVDPELVIATAATPANVWLTVPGASGTVALMNWRGYAAQIVYTDKPIGNRKGAKVPLDGGGFATIKLRGLVPGAPRVYRDGVEIFRAPQPPVWLVVLSALPALSLVLMQGIFGLVLALGGAYAAISIAKKVELSQLVRAMGILGVVLATWLVALVLVQLL